MKYTFYIVFCEYCLSLLIASKPVFPSNPYPLSFQNGNRRFNSGSQYTKTSRPDRTSFVLGSLSPMNKKRPSFRDSESSPGSVVFPGMSPNKGIKNQGGGILFPSQMPSREISSTTISSKETCQIKDGNIMFMNECKTLLKEDPCLPGEWLLLNKNGTPKCDKRPCKSEELFYKGECVNANDTSVCGVSEILYIEFTGEVYCDCLPFYIFDPSAKKCFIRQTQGSCAVGKYLDVDSENKVVCVNNPCMQDGFVKNPLDGECYKKDYVGTCSEMNDNLVFQSNKIAICSDIHSRNIFEVPALTACPEGSKRDYLGNCQRVFRLDSQGPFSHRVPSQQVSKYSQCQQGQIKYPDGSCRKINSLLGR